MNWRELKQNGVTTLGGAVSGGLDSCTATQLAEEQGLSPSAASPSTSHSRTRRTSTPSRTGCWAAAPPRRLSFPESTRWPRPASRSYSPRARYEGGYWNTTGIARPVTVRAILTELEKRGIDVLFHGATGRGNDQVRFQLAANVLDPSTSVYAPWRDPEFVEEFPGRQQMLEYCEANALPIKPPGESRYSTDANLLGPDA